MTWFAPNHWWTNTAKAMAKTNPKGAHEQGLFERNDAVLAAYDREVENQQEKNYRIKDNPEPDVHG